MKINIPSDLTQSEISDLMSKLAEQIKTAPIYKDEIYIWAIIDRSGSMETVRDDSIGGFNAFLKEQQDNKDGKAFMSINLFNDTQYVVEEVKAIEQIKPLTRETYVPLGVTALYDAIGQTIMTAKKLNKKNNIIVILTDGEDNSSKQFDIDKIKKMTAEAEENNWKFIYLGANQDVFNTTKILGISHTYATNYTSDSAGTWKAYNIASSYTSTIRSAFSHAK